MKHTHTSYIQDRCSMTFHNHQVAKKGTVHLVVQSESEVGIY